MDAVRIPVRQKVGGYIVLVAASLISVGPLVFLFATSLAPTFSRRVDLNTLLDPSLENYWNVFDQTDIGSWLLNSAIVATAVTISVLLVDTMAGFVLAKKKFKGRDALFYLMIATLMVPIPVTLLPLFLMMQNLGLGDTRLALIVPGLAVPLGVFLMRQFMLSIPDELIEAAQLDGLGDVRTLFRIVMPLSLPPMAVLAFLTFFFQWTSLIWPLVVASSKRSTTIPVGLTSWVGQYTTDWGLVSAGAVLAIVPVLLVFVVLSRQIAAGLVGERRTKA